MNDHNTATIGAKVPAFNVVDNIKEGIGNAMSRANNILERQRLFTDTMVGAIPVSKAENIKESPDGEGEMHQISYGLSKLNERLEEILVEQDRLTGIVRT